MPTLIKIAVIIFVILIPFAIAYSIFNKPQPAAIKTNVQSSPGTNQTYVPIDLSKTKISEVPEPRKPILVDLHAPNQTKASGYVRLSEVVGKILIQLKSDVPNSSRIGFIYKGSCKENGKIIYPLASLEDGKSQTIWETNMQSIEEDLPLSIRVFKDAKDLKNYTSCADITDSSL